MSHATGTSQALPRLCITEQLQIWSSFAVAAYVTTLYSAHQVAKHIPRYQMDMQWFVHDTVSWTI